MPKIWALILATAAKNAKTAHRCKDRGPPILASVGKNRQMCGVRAIHARVRRPTHEGEGEAEGEGGARLAGRHAIHLAPRHSPELEASRWLLYGAPCEVVH